MNMEIMAFWPNLQSSSEKSEGKEQIRQDWERRRTSGNRCIESCFFWCIAEEEGKEKRMEEE